ncbi:MAG: DNA-binding protein [Acidobacteria bacterium]|nr:MAG: DNA-binding protein [Acidobacteriota bacterium]
MNNGARQVLTQQEAGIFLGISANTISRLIRQGYIRAFAIPHPVVQFKNSRVVRIRIEELNRLISENDLTGGLTGSSRSTWINAHTCRKIPVALAARILGMKGTAVSEAIQRGTLNPTPEGLHDYILLRHEKELTTKIRTKYRAQIQTLQQQRRRYKKILKEKDA